MKEATPQNQDDKTISQPNKQRRRRRNNNPNKPNQGIPSNSQGDQSPRSNNNSVRSKGRSNFKKNNSRNFSDNKSKFSKPAVAVSQKTVTELLLPSATALHEFEYAVEGGAERLLNIAKAEQEHRHAWEKHALNSQIKSQRLGLLFGFFIALAALLVVQLLASAGNDVLAQTVVIAVFGSIALAIIISFLSPARKAYRKK